VSGAHERRNERLSGQTNRSTSSKERGGQNDVVETVGIGSNKHMNGKIDGLQHSRRIQSTLVGIQEGRNGGEKKCTATADNSDNVLVERVKPLYTVRELPPGIKNRVTGTVRTIRRQERQP
jgi:hypothetical protein